ncbi:pseudaminic acid biosynthesis-associated methylase [Elusimicrobiota bacterium]
MSFKTEQEVFWAGDFGNVYVDRNSNVKSVAHRTAVFAKILRRTRGISSVLELGANIGHNIHAVRNLLPSCAFAAVEINDKAIATLSELPDVKVFKGSIFDFSPADLGKHDLTFTSGVMIHINPKLLSDVYARLYECSNAYILVKEYYNPTPMQVNYRGHNDRLFKRDFAGEMLDKYPDLELVDYGFQYHRDYNFPADDSTWFLMKKKSV